MSIKKKTVFYKPCIDDLSHCPIFSMLYGRSKKELEMLNNMPDSEIGLSDIPETDFFKWSFLLYSIVPHGASQSVKRTVKQFSRSIKPAFLILCSGFTSKKLFIHKFKQVDNAVGISPFVIIPRNYFEEALFARKVVLERCLAIIDGRALVMNNIGGNDFFVAIA